jgi:LmbE family N-acetylglucosaminyl deacetylase
VKAFTKILLKRLSRAARPYLQSSGLLQVSGVYDRSALVWKPGAERVLVLAPHMDDETIGCGGTLALHAQRGADITVCFLTDGRYGSSRLSTLQGTERQQAQQELVEARKREAKQALQALGIKNEMICLDAEDGALRTTRWAADRIGQVLAELQPELVYLPFYLEEHTDHRAVSSVLIDGARGRWERFQCIGYEVWTPLFPNCLVRIDETLPLKKAALAHYETQLAETDYIHACVGLNAHRSAGLLDAKGGYAEAFHVASFADYRQQYARYVGLS